MSKFQGLPASAGIAIGPAWVYRPEALRIERHRVSDTRAEWERVQHAFLMARAQLAALEKRALETIGPDEAAIFGAHQLFLDDEDLLSSVYAAIEDDHLNGEAAVHDAFTRYAEALLGLEEDYFRARAQDVRDVGARALRCLQGRAADSGLRLTRPAIILAEDLTPSDTLQFERENILGICTVQGGPTSHTAILARGLGVPAVVGVPLVLDDVTSGTLVILDVLVNGADSAGQLTLGPTLAELERARQHQTAWMAQRAGHLASAMRPATTRDGHTVEVVANIGSAAEAQAALEHGAEGVGLFRTELLYLDHDRLPSEAEQTATYQEVFAVMGSRPMVVRTLDIGGDKAVSYLGVAAEPNPFLGWRGIRMIRERPDILEGQFRALLVAGAQTGADLHIMLPMVSSVAEVLRARELFEQARASLLAEGLAVPARVQLGIMVEVPSAALMADVIAPHVDFFSIGTNDLTQYTLAIDRTNGRVAPLASPYHPAVLRLIQMTIQAAHAHGKWVGLCGELGGDVLAVSVLLGLGLDEFSMAASSIPAVKDAIRKWTMADAQEVAAHVLTLPTAIEVIEYLQSLVQ